jgi:hypothetical protein
MDLPKANPVIYPTYRHILESKDICVFLDKSQLRNLKELTKIHFQ